MVLPGKTMLFNLDTFENELRHLVNIDSGSLCVTGVNKVVDWFQERYTALGWPTRIIATKPKLYGKSLFTWFGYPEKMDLLILCHADTVFPEGTAMTRPFAVQEDRYLGPGVADMKAGSLMTLHAVEQLRRAGRLKGNIGVFLNGEHELSCPTARVFIEQLSAKSAFVVSTEPARPNGACVRQRKGILRYKMVFHGRSAHSGVNPEAGICAVTEMANTILVLQRLNDASRGITVNPGIVSGGTSVNAIPDYAECHIDIRVVEQEDAVRLDEAVRQIARSPGDARVGVELSGGITRPPLSPSARADQVIGSINEIGRSYGIEMQWDFSGGGSDASFASALGKPALCGMGPVGGGYHTEQEYLQTIDLQERLCIFRDFVEAIGNHRI